MTNPTKSLVIALTTLPPELLERELLDKAEDQWFEKKGPAVSPRDLAKTLVGFANGAGGLVAVGVSETSVPGLDETDSKVQALADAATRFTMPPVRVHWRLLGAPAGGVLLMDVEASEEVHTLTNDECYLRVGAETRRLTFAERRELVYDKGQSFFDARPVVGATIRDLSGWKLSEYAKKIGAADPEGLARARGLLTNDKTPTIAGILVFGREPTAQIPQGFIRVVRYRGTEARSGRAMALETDRRIEAALPHLIDEAYEATAVLVPRVERLAAGGHFLEEPLYPPFALREAITNAVVHRSYSLGGDHIRISIFDDRVEIESPGRLPGLVREDNIRTTRYARNPHVARVMAELAYGREFGEGIDRMFQEMAAVGLPDPTIVQVEASVRVTLLGEPALSRVSAMLPGPAGARLVEHLHQIGRISSREAELLLGVSRATALKRLKALAKLGVLEWVAASTNDPTGFWRLRGRVNRSGG